PRRGRARQPALAGDARPTSLAGSARGSLPAADQFTSRFRGRTLDEIYSTHRSGNRLSGSEKRAVDSASVPSPGAAGEGAHPGGILGVCALGDPEAPAPREEYRDVSCQGLGSASTLQSADIVLPTTEAREIRLWRITNPSAEQQNLLARLNLTLPERIGLPLECSADSAVA